MTNSFTGVSTSFHFNLPQFSLFFCVTTQFLLKLKGLSNTESPDAAKKYVELIEKIERMAELCYFALTKVSVNGAFLPAFLITVVNYFLYDMGEKSFYLTVPVM